MSIYEITTIILSALTLLATIAISFVIYYLDNKRKDEERKRQNEQLAKAFIIDNNSINDYVPLCVMASTLNRHKKHIRSLYNEFNKLSNEVQIEVIKQCNYNIDLIRENEWVSESIEYVNKFINDNDLGNGRNNYLYDNGKYLHYAIKECAEKKYDDKRYEKKYQNPFPSKKIGFDENHNCLEYLIDFDTYCEEYMRYTSNEARIESKLYKKTTPKPIVYLENIENLISGKTSNEEVCYWVLDFVEFFTIYIINTTTNGYPDEYVCDAQIETFEDKYYDVMIALYNLYNKFIKKC